MSTLNKLVLVAAIGFGLHWWSQRDKAAALDVQPSASGFIPAMMPAGTEEDTVIIFAPVNCPSDAAQRADNLASQLEDKGISTVRKQSFSVNIPNPTEDDKASLERTASILNGELPAVFINGMGKSNPTTAEVIAEYQGNAP